jgi:CspA family cold shock protein
MRQQGTVQKWFDDKGYGFITTPGQTKNIFVHHKGVRREHDARERVNLLPGQAVDFELGQGEKGPMATDVVRL